MRIVITREYKKEQTACRNALKKWLRKNKKPVTYMADVLHYDRSSFNKWLKVRSYKLGKFFLKIFTPKDKYDEKLNPDTKFAEKNGKICMISAIFLFFRIGNKNS